MKAKEYAQRIVTASTEEARNKEARMVLADVYGEMGALFKSRNIRTWEGFSSLLDETDDKWQCICRLVEKGLGKPYLDKMAFRVITFQGFEDFKLPITGFWRPRRIAE